MSDPISEGARFSHLKTGATYRVLLEAIDCTNARDGTPVVVYQRVTTGDVFVRQRDEFLQKFSPFD